MNRRWLLALPLLAAGGAGVGFWQMLRGMSAGTFDPRSVGHPLLGKKVPPFRLPGMTDGDLRTAGRPVVLNFFASWCQPCIAEAPVLDVLAKSALIYGIAYKDKPDATAAFLARYGDPFARRAADQTGTVAIDFGVTGVPETFVVDQEGVVRFHYAGPLTEAIIAADITPRLIA